MNTFRDMWDAKKGDDDGRATLATELIATYLKAGSPKQVCIGDFKVAAVVADAERGTYSRDMFDKAQGIAVLTLELDIFPRFTESDAGRSLVRRADLCDGPKVETARKAKRGGKKASGPPREKKASLTSPSRHRTPTATYLFEHDPSAPSA